VKNEPTLRGRGVESFRQAAKTDAFQPQVFDGFDQLLHRTRQPIELLHNQRVAAACEFESIMQGGPIRDRTRNLFGENPLAPCFGQCVALQGKILLDGRNARVADQHRLRHREIGGGWNCTPPRGLRCDGAVSTPWGPSEWPFSV
jgi:hypothetical protein